MVPKEGCVLILLAENGGMGGVDCFEFRQMERAIVLAAHGAYAGGIEVEYPSACNLQGIFNDD